MRQKKYVFNATNKFSSHLTSHKMRRKTIPSDLFKYRALSSTTHTRPLAKATEVKKSSEKSGGKMKSSVKRLATPRRGRLRDILLQRYVNVRGNVRGNAIRQSLCGE
jgi:hypothetical protein